MSAESFDLLETAVATGGAESALDLLARKFIAEKQYPQLFDTRLMQKRLELGLPLIQLGSIEDLPEDGLILPMSAVYLTAKPPGPAGRWLIERLKQCPAQHAAGPRIAQPHASELAAL